jgi:hypothetical protein
MIELVQRFLAGSGHPKAGQDRGMIQFAFGMDEAENPGRMCVSFLALH